MTLRLGPKDPILLNQTYIEWKSQIFDIYVLKSHRITIFGHFATSSNIDLAILNLNSQQFNFWVPKTPTYFTISPIITGEAAIRTDITI